MHLDCCICRLRACRTAPARASAGVRAPRRSARCGVCSGAARRMRCLTGWSRAGQGRQWPSHTQPESDPGAVCLRGARMANAEIATARTLEGDRQPPST
eukprot:6184013-Pleurochrysis_carterae.AAC.3